MAVKNECMIMGNQAIALGALKAGVCLATGYPGTPSSEILEALSSYTKDADCHVEWSVNEKAAVEVAAAASYAGSRTLVTMKQVGLNVAADPVLCLSYIGTNGGMVIVSADDPGPISSQTEQDSRTFAVFAKIPVFDPSSPKEAYEMVQDAFEISEKYNTPVLLRPTTRVCHAYQSMNVPVGEIKPVRGAFKKDTTRYVIFPHTSFLNHQRIFARNETALPQHFSNIHYNRIEVLGGIPALPPLLEKTSFGIATSGISYAYTQDALLLLKEEFPQSKALDRVRVLKIGTPYPFPEERALGFLDMCTEILVIEELDPFIEGNLIFLCGKHKKENQIYGKHDTSMPCAGENSVASIKSTIAQFLGLSKDEEPLPPPPALPVRPPVLCAGCPHRASFYAVKKAMKGKKTVYCGDIGCYTLGNASPLDMCDTCLCMGADITMAQGFFHTEPDTTCFSFIGDSTFFASGITGVVNAVFNKARITICVLDNSTTAMTGHQVHPGSGRTIQGEATEKISIEKILLAIGVFPVLTVNPFDQTAAKNAVTEAVASSGVSAIIFKAPCIAIAQKQGYIIEEKCSLDEKKCVGCKKCVTEIGCPALNSEYGKTAPAIDTALCTGCGLCATVCPTSALFMEKKNG